MGRVALARVNAELVEAPAHGPRPVMVDDGWGLARDRALNVLRYAGRMWEWLDECLGAGACCGGAVGCADRNPPAAKRRGRTGLARGRAASWSAGRAGSCRSLPDRSGPPRRANRKRDLTAVSSSRWAGAITRTSEDQWRRAYANLLDARIGLRRAVERLQARLAVLVGQAQGHGRTRVRGYESQAERLEKQRRLQQLRSKLGEVEGRLAAGRVSVCRGGHRLAKLRQAVASATGASGEPATIALDLDGLPASTRNGRLRAAVAAIIRLARAGQCRSIMVEDLDFADTRQTGRGTLGRGKRGKRFRRTVAGMPTRAFRDLLVGMAANANLWVVTVDPAWTSKWGQRYWQEPLTESTKTSVAVSRHHAAAVVIGRRGLGLGARRRPGVTRPHRRMGKGELPARPGGRAVGCEGPGPPGGQRAAAQPHKTCQAERIRLGNQAVQDRLGPPQQDSLLLNLQER